MDFSRYSFPFRAQLYFIYMNIGLNVYADSHLIAHLFFLIFFFYLCFVLGENAEGKKIFLRDIWPSREEVLQVEENVVIPSMFKELKVKIEVRKDSLWLLGHSCTACRSCLMTSRDPLLLCTAVY